MLENISSNKRIKIITKEYIYILPINEVAYIKYENRHAVFYMDDNRHYEIPKTLEEIKSMLSSEFMYCHRSCIVNTNLVTVITKKERQLLLRNGTVITDVSLAYLKEIMKCI